MKRNHAKFTSPSKRKSIFFDECNRDIISLNSDVLDDSSRPKRVQAVCQQTDEPKRIEFTLAVDRKILSIKMNPTRSVIAYHAERNIIEFINVKEKNLEPAPGGSSSPTNDEIENWRYTLEDRRYTQNSRSRNSKLIGFLWTGPAEVIIITDLSVEYYRIDTGRRRVSLIKVFQSATNWFVYQPLVRCDDLENNLETSGSTASSSENARSSTSPLLIVSTGSIGNSMQPYHFIDGQVKRLQKFDVEGDWNDSNRLELFEKSITIGHIYGLVRLLVLQHESLNLSSHGAQIVMYTIVTELGTTQRTHILDLDTSGRFAINVIDNLVIAHDQPSKTSFIFDIAIRSTEKSDCPNHFVSLIDSQPIRSSQADLNESTPRARDRAELYSLNWVFFQPDFIVDAKLGSLSTLKLDLEAMQSQLLDNHLLLTFLAHRINSAELIVAKCGQIVLDSYKQVIASQRVGQQNPLADVSSAFEILGSLVRPAMLKLGKSEQIDETIATDGAAGPKYAISIDQKQIDQEIFGQLMEEMEKDLDQAQRPASFHFVLAALLEFVFAVRCRGQSVDYCIYERLVKCLAQCRKFFQIIQLIRSKILEDSKQLACLLISLERHYTPAGRMGLDMLHRLGCEL